MTFVQLEFSRFKQEINLTQYAAALGYEIDRRKSTRQSIAMRKGNEDKIIISRQNGNWIYFSVYDDNDNGTIIDFIKNRTNKSIRQIGLELDEWLGNPSKILNHYKPFLKEKGFEPKRIQRLFNYCKPAYNHSYLHGRGITNETLCSSRFVNRVFQDQFKNAVFPHFKRGVVCGLELKGERTDLFVRGSEKTLWRSNRKTDDNTLIIAESPINAMSYHIIHKMNSSLYTATCGGFSKKQAEIITGLVSECRWIEEIILATDNDKGGDKITSRLENIINETSYSEKLRRHSPNKRGCDWNNVLTQFGI